MLKSEERQALPESVELSLSELSLEEIAALEGTALGSVIKEINDRPVDQPTAAHKSYSKYSAHGKILWR